MESMQAINAVTCTPVIRPVVTMDKLEIIDLAQKIDTFDISIQPFEDCCTILHLTVQRLIQKSNDCDNMNVVWMLTPWLNVRLQDHGD